MNELKIWRKCNACKKDIPLNSKYFVCSVSTCNGLRTGYVFCSMPCFERHLPGARHRDAGAIEKTAPSVGDDLSSTLSPNATPPPTNTNSTPPQRIQVRPNNDFKNGIQSPSGAKSLQQSYQKEVLVIASRFKDYISARADVNTSGSVFELLSDYLRLIADRGIENARSDGRKTVMEKDFEFLKK